MFFHNNLIKVMLCYCEPGIFILEKMRILTSEITEINKKLKIFNT